MKSKKNNENKSKAERRQSIQAIYFFIFSFSSIFPRLQIGFDGGQRQWFIMEIFDQQTNMLQANISSKYPVFTVSGLDSGKLLKIIIYAINVKGRSDSVILEAFTLKAAEKQTGKLSFCLFSFLFDCHIPSALFSNKCASLFNHTA